MTKKELRQQFAAQRKAITLPEMHQLVANMLHQFQQIALPNVHYFLSFKSSSAKQEVPVHFFEEHIRDQYSHAVTCYPKAEFANSWMEAYADDQDLEMEETVYGIEQPSAGNIVLPSQLDVVLVPLLAFDEKGFRIGYGKGFYDRYLARCRPNVLKIGISFFDPVSIISDTNEYDVPLSYCVTPQRLYVF
jgi:5-formyltetrahydrofolate cyclo-ligase